MNCKYLLENVHWTVSLYNWPATKKKRQKGIMEKYNSILNADCIARRPYWWVAGDGFIQLNGSESVWIALWRWFHQNCTYFTLSLVHTNRFSGFFQRNLNPLVSCLRTLSVYRSYVPKNIHTCFILKGQNNRKRLVLVWECSFFQLNFYFKRPTLESVFLYSLPKFKSGDFFSFLRWYRR